MVLALGEMAPKFSLKSKEGGVISLEDLRGGWSVLYFYPKDDTPGCTIEAKDFTGFSKEFDELEVEVFGVSPDSEESHCRFSDKHKLDVNLLSDPTHKTIEDYGAWGQKHFLGKKYMGVLRTTYIINPSLKVAFVWEDVKPKGHAEEVLKKMRELV